MSHHWAIQRLGSPLWSRPLPSRQRVLALGACLVLGLTAMGGTGIGATSLPSSVPVTTTVLASIALADPAALNPAPAPASSGVTWTPGAPDVLNLEELQPTDQAHASLTWRVTTANPTGYTVTLANTGSAPVLKSGANSIADMAAIPAGLDLTKSHFGVAAGDAVGHSETSVNYAGSPWGTTGGSGTQGTLYRGVPTAGVEVARMTTGATNEPTTLNFAAVSAASQPITAGSYTGTVRLTASTI